MLEKGAIWRLQWRLLGNVQHDVGILHTSVGMGLDTFMQVKGED